VADVVEAWGPDGVGLRVEFAQRGDRVGHVIRAIQRAESLTAPPGMQSREGSASDVWPPSPPLQSIHLERRAEGKCVALLVGLSGKSHWSLSVEPVAGAAALKFDVACRLNAEPASLGSAYDQLQPDLIVESSDLVVCDEQRVAIEPASLGPGTKLPRTVRWTYLVRRET
jgi:hypothetical protein